MDSDEVSAYLLQGRKQRSLLGELWWRIKPCPQGYGLLLWFGLQHTACVVCFTSFPSVGRNQKM